MEADRTSITRTVPLNIGSAASAAASQVRKTGSLKPLMDAANNAHASSSASHRMPPISDLLSAAAARAASAKTSPRPAYIHSAPSASDVESKGLQHNATSLRAAASHVHAAGGTSSMHTMARHNQSGVHASDAALAKVISRLSARSAPNAPKMNGRSEQA